MGIRNKETLKWFNNSKGFGFIQRDEDEDTKLTREYALKQKAKNYLEIKKNSIVVAQGIRTGSLFFTLPVELSAKIVSYLSSNFHTEEEANRIAYEHLSRPK